MGVTFVLSCLRFVGRDAVNRTTMSLGAVVPFLFGASMLAAESPAVDGYGGARTMQGRARALANSEFVTYRSLAKTSSEYCSRFPLSPMPEKVSAATLYCLAKNGAMNDHQ